MKIPFYTYCKIYFTLNMSQTVLQGSGCYSVYKCQKSVPAINTSRCFAQLLNQEARRKENKEKKENVKFNFPSTIQKICKSHVPNIIYIHIYSYKRCGRK